MNNLTLKFPSHLILGRHPVTNDYVPDEIKDMVFLKSEGDISDKIWDEDALGRWELKKNHGMRTSLCCRCIVADATKDLEGPVHLPIYLNAL